MDSLSRRTLLAGLAAMTTLPAAAQSCRGRVYLTLDTGTMTAAEHIAEVMRRHGVKATFFLANEPTFHGDHCLDDGWAPYWKARVAEGHHFGSHTWRHWYFRSEPAPGRVSYVAWGGKQKEELDRDGVCREISRVGERFRAMTGRALDPIWRAPGGRTTPNTLAWAQACGFRHVGWSDAGFLGDELDSDKYPNDALLKRALARIKDGDVLMMHLGIRDRRVPFAEVFEPLIAGLKAKGLCFATIQ
jgi:peptidoglycan/xylan/chitin deacetylase (PgdA/CDA1 family)